MFGFERFWNYLTDWKSQTSRPEATMFNAHHASKAACLALTAVGKQELLDNDEGKAAN